MELLMAPALVDIYKIELEERKVEALERIGSYDEWRDAWVEEAEKNE